LGWWRNWRLLVTTALMVACVDAVLPAAPVAARNRLHRRHSATRRARKPAPAYRGALLEDADSGAVLYEVNPDMEWPPASMAKMMLLLVATDQIKAGRVSINAPVRISERSATTGGSRLGLREGQVFPLGELMKAALIRSANDAAVAVAEKIAGSTTACVRMMNQRARSLGLTHTVYNTVDGLPPRPAHDVDVTDAYDLATLGRALIKNTNLLQWSGQEQALFDDGEAILHNTNHLIGHFEGCDGLKTGFTYQAGFNLTATAKRGDMRLIAVVLGAPSNRERFRQAALLLEWGFDNFTRVTVVKRGEPLLAHVQVTEGPLVQPIAADDLKVVVAKNKLQDLKIDYDVPSSVSGPLAVGAPLGQVIVHDGTRVLSKVNALSPVSVANTVQVDSRTPAEPAGTGNTIRVNSGASGNQPAVAVCCVNQPQVTR